MYDKPWYEVVDDDIVHVLMLDPGSGWHCVECNIDHEDNVLRGDSEDNVGDVDEFVIVGGTPTNSPVVARPDPWLEYSETEGWQGIVEMISLMPEGSVQAYDVWQNRKSLEDVVI
jgi:hypothetical protein